MYFVKQVYFFYSSLFFKINFFNPITNCNSSLFYCDLKVYFFN